MFAVRRKIVDLPIDKMRRPYIGKIKVEGAVPVARNFKFGMQKIKVAT